MAIRRRAFLAGAGGFGLGVALGGVSHWLPLEPPHVGPAWAPERETFVASTCLLCPAHCGIRGRLLDGKLVRVDGNPLHPVSRGGLCPKGRAGIQLPYHPARLTGPVERVGAPGSADFRPIPWDEALARVQETLGSLRASGRAGSVALQCGAVTGAMGEILEQFTAAYGTPHLIRDGYDDGSALVMELCQGMHAPPAFDLESSDLVLSFGAGLSEAWWCLPQAAQARAPQSGRGPRWVQVDARLSRTAARADEWIPVRPGTYGALAMGIAYVILKEGLYAAEGIKERVHGLDDAAGPRGSGSGYRTLVLRHGRTEDIAARTGLPAETIVRLAKAFGGARRGVAIWDQTVSWRSGGLSDALAIHALNVLVGALDRPGGVLVQPPLPLKPVRNGPDPGPTAGQDAGALTAADWPRRVSGGETPLQAMVLYQANPVASSPRGGEVVAALESIPLVVSFSPFLDETARHAHLVLPDHTYLERWQDAPAPGSVPIPVWGVVQPMMEPLHDTRATGDILLSLAAGLGEDMKRRLPWSSMAEIVRDRGRSLATARRGGPFETRYRQDELREMEARGWWLPHGMSTDEFWEKVREQGGWFDPYYDYNDRTAVSGFPDGKVRIFSPQARERAGAVSGLAEGFLPLQAEGAAPAGEGPLLRLIPYRVMTLASGGTALMPWLLESLGVMTGDAWETWVEVNPETGRAMGLTSGQMVRVQSSAGEFRARLRFYDGAQPGVVNVPYGLHTSVEGWGKCNVTNPLVAVGEVRDPATGLPDWYSARVRLVPA